MADAVGIEGWGYLLVVGLAVPWGAGYSAREIGRQALPPRPLFLFSVIGQQVLLLGLAVWVAGRESIAIPWAVTRPSGAAVMAVLLTVGLIAAGRPMWRSAVRRRDRIAYFTMPRTRGERVLWVGVSLAAGIGEEVAYRCVLFALLQRVLGSPLSAAIVAAVVFGAAHLVQGGRASAILTGVALVFQAFVWQTGGLAAAIAVHATYDVVAGLAYGWYGARLGYPVEGVPLAGGGVPG